MRLMKVYTVANCYFFQFKLKKFELHSCRYAIGKKAMLQIAKKKILIIGLNGLGLEIAKNIVLSGVNEVALHDDDLLSSGDLSSFFYGNNNDVGKNRVNVCLQQLCELNEYVKVEHLSEQLSQSVIARYDVVVFCEARSNSRIIEINEWCRNVKSKFILANAKGLFGMIFCDFGSDYVVLDVSGTEPEAMEVNSIEKSEYGLVYVSGDKGHGLCDESLVTFTGLQGMEELNDKDPLPIYVVDYRCFQVGNTENYPDHIPGTGFVKEIFLPKPMEFKPYSSFINTVPKSAEIVISDYSKLSYPRMLHLCFLAVTDYRDRFEELPRSWNNSDAKKFAAVVQEHATRCGIEITHSDIIEIFSFVARGNLNPLHASLGGIVAQEVLKAASLQFTPITQWYYSDFVECLPEDYLSLVDSDIFDMVGSRYDGQLAVFGRHFQQKLENMKYFVIGAGAIGCELLKNLAMMGVATGESGKIFVTDMDFIERSNLNRQFLFRNWNIGQSKSQTAAKAVQKMNPNIHIEAHENRLGPETENFYNNGFFQSLDCVVNALDNVEARLYAASRIEFNGRPMIDSGTMGSQASQQVIIPKLTKSYFATKTSEATIPICTLKNFPYQIEHTIQWAKDLFTTYFTNTPKLVKVFNKDKSEFFKTVDLLSPYQKFDTVNQVLSFLKSFPKSFDDCITWGLNEWFCHFSKNIQQVLHSFPANCKSAEGLPFWSGTKRVPRFEEFDVEKDYHMNFLLSVTKLRARLFKIELKSDQYIKSFAKSFQFDPFIPSSTVKIATEDAEIDSMLDLAVLNLRTNELRNLDFKEILNIDPQDFEKDDDSNFHIDFISGASNMRAYNYKIEQADRMKTKKIAGNIIPAMATTTSVISGQVCMELFKTVQGHTNVRKYRDSYLNLSSPVFTMTIPEKPLQHKVLDNCYTLWDTFDVQGDMSLKDFLELMKNEYAMDVTCVTYKTGVLFATWFDKEYLDEIRDLKMVDIMRNKINQVVWESETVIPIFISIEDDNGEDIEGIPVVRYHL